MNKMVFKNNIIFIIIIVLAIFLVTKFLKYRVIKKLNFIDFKEVKLNKEYNLKAVIKTDKGDIELKLFPNIAPITVTNFVNLATKGYYNGLKFHRVIADFMIQGGDPTGTGAGGPGYNFRDEFVEGIEFNKSGILAMANAGPNTNGSQFFITHVPTEWLNYKHTIFGEVLNEDTQKIVDSISQGDIMNEVIISGDLDEFLKDMEDVVEQFNSAMSK
ncbi:peptidyl-prolyl cis-trans isomerase B (cyclophilin B) [Hypnocyclicus thermotrophus]|uniref:Peptidyl-prolyl cis-trans isomerase n=1 Tax=Hypnocyclicus thermotrophus TaxID=1627895 RepID=A0AA46I6P5_9FUSO|nr:peptidyl-prolyl cis-trans isomerase B (cyclophilin B) [Hypnocyclicus thermotrophus]